MSNTVFEYEIPSENPDQARRFYSGAFGWRFTKGETPASYTASSLAEGAPMFRAFIHKQKHKDHLPVTIRVVSLEDALMSVTANGGKVLVGKKVIPDVGYLAYCEDPEGNVFGVFAPDPQAK